MSRFFYLDKFKLINGTKRFFIHESGYVFKVHDGKDYPIKIQMLKGVPKVNIGNKKLNIVLLMVEYFGDGVPKNFRYTYKISNGKIPLKNIKITSVDGLNTKDDKDIVLWKCKEKANSQNFRSEHIGKIRDVDVLNSLKRNEFKCQYCDSKLKYSSWHLDHVHPLSKGGLNIETNITCACKECNLMKGAIPLDKFLHQITLIAKNYQL